MRPGSAALFSGIVLALFFAGCATPRGVAFQPASLAGKEPFPPRGKPALSTKKSMTDLMLEGYLPLGQATWWVEEAGIRSETTPPLLEEAGRLGADFVILTRDREHRFETRYRQGRCLREERHSREVQTPRYRYDSTTGRQTQDGYNSRTEYYTLCLEYEKIPYTVELTESAGQLFRREPERIRKMSGLVLIEAVLAGKPEAAMELLRAGATPDDTGKGNETALSEAAARGYDDVVALLLSRGADVDRTGKGDERPLARAAAGGHLGTVKLLASKGANLSGASGQGAMLAALVANRREVVDYLLGRKVSLEPSEGGIALRKAAEDGSLEQAKLALRCGASPDGKFAGELTPLMAAVRGGHIEVARLLLDRGASVNARNRDNGYTPLFYAVTAGNDAMVRLLAERGGDVDARLGEFGKSLLQVAKGRPAIEKILIERGARKTNIYQ